MLGIGPERFDGPAPAEIMVKVLGGDAMEWAQPFLQTAMVAGESGEKIML